MPYCDAPPILVPCHSHDPASTRAFPLRSSSPWARRLVQVAGYLAPPPGQPPLPLIRLEYRLRVRGIMLPRR